MASFDVKSLFTNVPVEGALSCLERRLNEFHFLQLEIEELVSLTRICLSQNTFVFNKHYYKMCEGLAMGSPLSPILSDIYMHYFEEKLFSSITFPFYCRYVDDSFVLLDNSFDDINVILSQMNSIDPCIQFTSELEKDMSISFLDVLVYRTMTGFKTTVYRKPFSVCLPPHKFSCHPYSQKIAAFNTFVFRAISICSNSDLLSLELNYIKAIAIDRGFSADLIDNIFNKLTRKRHSINVNRSNTFTNCVVLPFYPKVSQQIAKILRKFNFSIIFSPTHKTRFSNLKDPLETLNSWGIYQISCSCGLSYIGQTRRALKFRLKEHQNYIKNGELNKSSIASHCWNCSHHFDFSSAHIIQKCSSVYDLDFYESFHINKNINNLVNDLSMIPFFAQIWRDRFNNF